MTLGFLFLTIVFLLCLRAMKCNKTSIINNGGTALFLSELIFILGINQADHPVMSPHTRTYFIQLFFKKHICVFIRHHTLKSQ